MSTLAATSPTSTPASGTGLLRLGLGLDAAATVAFALPLAFASGELSGLFGLPALLLLGAGAFLLPWAAFLIWATRQRVPSRRTVWTVLIVNTLWVIDTALLWASGWVQPTLWGEAFLAVNVVGVSAFTVLQYLGLRRMGH
jgi:hypothetical protein